MAELITALPEQLYSVLPSDLDLFLSTSSVELDASRALAISCVYALDLPAIRLSINNDDIRTAENAERTSFCCYEKSLDLRLQSGFLLSFRGS